MQAYTGVGSVNALGQWSTCSQAVPLDIARSYSVAVSVPCSHDMNQCIQLKGNPGLIIGRLMGLEIEAVPC